MKVLALDTACAACSVAVLDGDDLRAARFEPMARGQTEALMPMVGAAMEDAALGYDALDLVAVTVGPGSFTGLRTGLAAARGIALGCGVALAGVTTLETVARPALASSSGRPVLAVLTTGRAELYAQRFGADGAPLDDAAALLPGALAGTIRNESLLLAGDGADALRPLLGNAAGIGFAAGPGLPRAEDVARIAASRGVAAGAPPRPIYLYPPRATPPAPGRSLAP
jgi:tRNA threonylcarbamoyladenosine biosynthesis protein TsaB